MQKEALTMNFKGITNKLMDKADWLAFLASGYMRYDGDLGRLAGRYIAIKPALEELQRSLNPRVAQYKLFESPHAYTGIFQASLIGYIACELGVIPSKYKKALTKAMIGSGAAALTLPSSGPEPSGGGLFGGGHSSGGNSPSWGYKA